MTTLRQHIENIVHQELIETKGNQSKAARQLDITRNTLRKYMDKDIGYRPIRINGGMIDIRQVQKVFNRLDAFLEDEAEQNDLVNEIENDLRIG